jgi:HpiC1 cyclase
MPPANPAGARAARVISWVVFSLAALAAGVGTGRAAAIAIPNYSFESPPTTLATPLVDSWQQTPVPDLNNQNTFQTGVFSNVPPPIDNCDGGQAAFLFAYPGVALAQDYDSTDYANPTPTHAFDATFEAGKSYTLTVGVIGGGGGMVNGATLELSLYYRDPLSNVVTVAATNITNSPSLFPSTFHFVDFQVQVPVVTAGDPWAGQHIGVQLLSSITDTNLDGGYWDVDNVRLSSTIAPVLLAPLSTAGQFTFTVLSEPGLQFEILASTNLSLPLSNWTSLGTLTNTSGTAAFLDSATDFDRRFYRARQLP